MSRLVIKSESGVTNIRLVWKEVPENWDLFENSMFEMYREQLKAQDRIIKEQKDEIRLLKIGAIRIKLQDILDGII